MISPVMNKRNPYTETVPLSVRQQRSRRQPVNQ